MQREMIWASADGIGSEYLCLNVTEAEVIADSVCFATREVEPSRVRYLVTCDPQWRVREVTVEVERPFGMPDALRLRSDGEGTWRTGKGEPLPHLDGCIDIDLSCSPFTNTLPIRRLGLQPGQVEDIRVTYIHVPSLQVEPWNQRYTGISERSVRYESVDSDFRRELEIDLDGLVVDYPGLFTRVWSR
jgi:hypothetical protein